MLRALRRLQGWLQRFDQTATSASLFMTMRVCWHISCATKHGGRMPQPWMYWQPVRVHLVGPSGTLIRHVWTHNISIVRRKWSASLTQNLNMRTHPSMSSGFIGLTASPKLFAACASARTGSSAHRHCALPRVAWSQCLRFLHPPTRLVLALHATDPPRAPGANGGELAALPILFDDMGPTRCPLPLVVGDAVVGDREDYCFLTGQSFLPGRR